MANKPCYQPPTKHIHIAQCTHIPSQLNMDTKINFKHKLLLLLHLLLLYTNITNKTQILNIQIAILNWSNILQRMNQKSNNFFGKFAKYFTVINRSKTNIYCKKNCLIFEKFLDSQLKKKVYLVLRLNFRNQYW